MANRKDHTIVFILTTMLFIIGVFSGITISRTRMNEVESKIELFEYNMNSLEMSVLVNDALKNETLSCNFLKGAINETQQRLLELGEKAVEYETESKIKDDNYQELKKVYNSARAKYWLLLERLKNQCNNNYTTILFFYRTKTTCEECREQGVILSHLGLNNPDIYIVPLDSDEELLITKTIKEAFNINSTPTLVINAETKLTGLITSDEILLNLGRN